MLYSEIMGEENIENKDVPRALDLSVKSLTCKHVNEGGTGEREVDVILTYEEKDRDGDIVSVEGMDLGPYRDNPVVLRDHNRKMPVARGKDVSKSGNEITATAVFPPEGQVKDSDETYALIQAKMINAVSIGFIPGEYDMKHTPEGDVIWYVPKSELLEFSFVTVPSNRAAVITRRSENQKNKIKELISRKRAKRVREIDLLERGIL